MKIQAIKSLKTGMYESFAYELRDWTFKFIGHDSIGMKAQYLSYHPCWVVKTYWACMTFSKRDFSFVMSLTQYNAMQDKN